MRYAPFRPTRPGTLHKKTVVKAIQIRPVRWAVSCGTVVGVLTFGVNPPLIFDDGAQTATLVAVSFFVNI